MNPVINLNIELKFPDESVPLYTVEDYMRDTDNGSRADYECMLAEAEARGQGFGFTYMSAVEKSVKVHGKAWADYNAIRKDASDNEIGLNFDETGKLLNTVLETTYTDAAIAMQAYIIKKNGVIDCWPDANSASTFDFYNTRKYDKNDTTKVGINYFAPKIKEKKDDDGTHYSRSHEPFYRNACPCTSSPELISMDKKINELKRVPAYTKGQKFGNNAKHIIAALPLILSVIVVLLMAFWRIAGIDVEAFADSISWKGMGKIGTVIMIILGLCVQIIAFVYQLLSSNIALIIVCIFLLGAGFAGYGALGSIVDIDKDWISKKDIEKGIAAKNELEALISSEEYKRIVEENKEYRNAQRELSEKWHKAWFEKVKHRVFFMENA